MPWLRSVVAVAVLTAYTVGIGPALCGERSFPADCLPDRIVSWDTGDAAPSTLFGAPLLPGIVLGPPGDSLVFNGSLSVGHRGIHTLSRNMRTPTSMRIQTTTSLWLIYRTACSVRTAH